MGNGELPTWLCGPHRQPPVCPAREPGSPGTARPEGSRTRGRGPDRPTDHPQATRRPKTVRGRPPGRTHSCSVARNGPGPGSALPLELAPAAGAVVGDDLPEHGAKGGRVDRLALADGHGA